MTSNNSTPHAENGNKPKTNNRIARLQAELNGETVDRTVDELIEQFRQIRREQVRQLSSGGGK